MKKFRNAVFPLLGLFCFVLFSCSLNFTHDTTVLDNFDPQKFQDYIDGKSWGTGKTCADSDICVRFISNGGGGAGKSGEITLKNSQNGSFGPAGTWFYDPFKSRLTLKSKSGVTADYRVENMTIKVVVEYRGRDLHLVN